MGIASSGVSFRLTHFPSHRWEGQRGSNSQLNAYQELLITSCTSERLPASFVFFLGRLAKNPAGQLN